MSRNNRKFCRKCNKRFYPNKPYYHTCATCFYGDRSKNDPYSYRYKQYWGQDDGDGWHSGHDSGHILGY